MMLKDWQAVCTLPRAESRMLLQHITGLSRAQLITRDQTILSDTQIKVLNDLASRRQLGEPMAYLLGYREFYGRNFLVSPATLIPRPETEHLLEAALTHLPPNGILWDLGTGSGIIAISTQLERPDARVFASDISHDALAIAQKNTQRLGANITFAQGSWFDANTIFALPPHSVHVIASNPPYIEAEDAHLQQGDLRFEPQNALTDFADGLTHIRTLATQSRPLLAPNGTLLLEHGYNQGAAVRNILAQNGFQHIETLPDLAGHERVTLGVWIED